MAKTLLDTMKSNQGLATASAEEMAAQKGMAAAPTSPMETGVIGGNPDQSKMAGTPNQKGNAIRQSIQEADDLATAVRRGQGRTEQTAGEKASGERIAAFEGLGGLDERVDQIAQERVDAAMTDEQALKDQQWSEDTEVQALIDRVRANPNDFEAVKLLNDKYGTADAPLNAQELVDKFTSVADAAAARLTEATSGIVGSDVDFTQMGYGSNDEVAALLGVDPAEFAGMTVPQITQKIDSLLQTEYNQVDTLQASLNDPNLGPAERSEIRQQLRNLGAVGVRKAETAAEELADSVANAETVTIFGEDVKIGDVIEDEYFKGVISNYLGMTDEAKAEFDKDNPGFGEFIKKYEDEFKVLTEDMDEGTKALAGEKTKDDQFQTQHGFDDDFMDEITDGEWSNSERSESVVGGIEEQYPAMALLNPETSTINLEQRTILENNIKQIKSLAPDFLKEMMGMDEWQLKELGLLDGPEGAQELLAVLDQDRVIAKVDPSRPETVINALDPNMDEEGFYNLVQSIKAGINMGTIPAGALNSIPGLAEMDFAKISAWMQTQIPDSLGAAGRMKSLTSYLKDLKKSATAFEDSPVPEKVRNQFANKEALNSGDLTVLGPMSTAEVSETLTYMNENPEKFTESGSDEITHQYQTKRGNDVLGELKAVGIVASDINDLLSQIKDGTITEAQYQDVVHKILLGLKAAPPQQQLDMYNEIVGNKANFEAEREREASAAEEARQQEIREEGRKKVQDRIDSREAGYNVNRTKPTASVSTSSSEQTDAARQRRLDDERPNLRNLPVPPPPSVKKKSGGGGGGDTQIKNRR